MKKLMFSLLAAGITLAMASVDASAYSKSGKATPSGGGTVINCDLTMATCFSDGGKNTVFVPGEVYKVYDGTPGGREYTLYSATVSDEDGTTNYVSEPVEGGIELENRSN